MKTVNIFAFVALCCCSSPGGKDGNADSVIVEETEREETDRLLRERHQDDEKAFAELVGYDGLYSLQTESEGAEGALELAYKGDKVFSFKLELKALDICRGSIDGEILMDRTQHGFYETDSCLLHFNFMGSSADAGTIVEIEQPEPCNKMQGECIFGGTYTSAPMATRQI